MFWYETTYQNKLIIDILYEEVRKLTEHLDKFVYIIDLTRAKRPNSEARDNLKRMFEINNLRFTSIYTESNFFLNVAAKFVLSSVVDKSKFDVFKKREQAIQVSLEYSNYE